MDRFAWFYDELMVQVATLKTFVFSIIRKIPLLGDLGNSQMEWIFIGLIFVVITIIAVPLIKWSAKIALSAAGLAAILAFVTSFSFWGLLPFTGLGVAIVLFSNKFQME